MTKVLSLIVVLAVLFSLAACGSKTAADTGETSGAAEATQAAPADSAATEPAPAEPVELNLFTQFADPNSKDGNFIAFYKTLEAIKTALPNITLKHEGISGDAYKTKLKTDMAANELPDIFFTWGAGFAEPMVNAGQVLALDDYLKDGTMDRIVTGTMTNFTYNGKIYGLPYSIATANLYCNKELFDQNGLKLPETYEDLVAAVKAFSGKGITPLIVGEKDLWPGLMIYGILATRSAGAQAFNDALLKKASYDTPELLAAANKIKELNDLKAFGANPLGTSYEDAMTAYKNGKAAMMFMGTWVNGEFEADGVPVKGKTVPIKFPVLDGAKGTINEFHGGSGETFMISNNTQYKDQAVQAIKFICENMSKEQYLAGSGAPAWKGDMGDTSQLNPLSVATGKLAGEGTGFVYWLDVMTSAADAETIKNSIAGLLANKLTPEAFCKELQKMNTAN
jgi:raffinose/stachyose/melibiose transport system substrate-binding protein